MQKNICSFNSSFHFFRFPWLQEFFLAKRTALGASFDLIYSNNLIHFLVNLSPLTLFDIQLKLIAGITCICKFTLYIPRSIEVGK